jgi:hypothetical protein
MHAVQLKDITVNGPNIPEETMREMAKFFEKTSVPRILAERERRLISEKKDSDNESANNPNEFEKLTPRDRNMIVDWIVHHLNQIQSFNPRHISCEMKQLFEGSETGFYISNGTFKGAMADCGFKVKDKTELNWVFNVSEKSKAIQRGVIRNGRIPK